MLKDPGGPEKLLFESISTPQPTPDEVLVRVRACSVNRLDIWLRNGLKAYGIQYPHILGCDIAGTIEQLGSESASKSTLKEGDRVLVAPGVSCFRCDHCRRGQDNLCEKFTIMGAGRPGGYAEFVAAPARNIIPIPAALSFEEAAAFPLVFLTAWHMLVTRGGIKAGQKILILGGGSGIGSAAIQIAKYFHTQVIATVGSEWKIEATKDLGADLVINHSTSHPERSEGSPSGEDWEEKVKSVTGGQGVDLVFEHIGPATWQKSIRILRKGGTLVTCGATSGAKAELDLRYVYSRELNIHGSIMGTRQELNAVVQRFENGDFRPVVDSVFPLEQVADAHRKVESRRIFGKVVLSHQR